jgi:hypothetical protein
MGNELTLQSQSITELLRNEASRRRNATLFNGWPDGMVAAFAELTDILTRHEERIAALELRLDALTGRVSALDVRVTNLDGSDR